MTGDRGRRSGPAPLPGDRREQLALLSRTLEREAHILAREPEVLASHLHNTLHLDEGDEGPAGPLLARARDALAARPWLRLTNRPAVERSALIRVMEHEAPVEALAWSPDCRTIASGGWDSAIRLWDASTGRCRAVLRGHANSVEALAWSPNGRILASSSLDFTLRLWDPVVGECRDVVEGDTVDTGALAWSPDGAILASAGPGEVVRLRDPASGQTHAMLRGHNDWIDALAWSPDKRTLASASRDGTIRLWNTGTGRCCRTLEAAGVNALAWSRDGRTLASAGDSAIRVWDAGTGALRRVLEGHSAPVLALAWSPHGDTLASASIDKTIRVWDVSRGSCRAVLVGHTGWVKALAWSPDGCAIASGCGGSGQAGADNSVRLWDPSAGVSGPTVEGHSRAVHALAWSPDGASLASGGEDHSVRLWDPTTGEGRAVLEGHGGLVKALAWSPDSQALASAAFDGSIRLWHSVTGWGGSVLQPPGDAAPWALAWSPDGTVLASGGSDCTVRLWACPTGKPVAVLEGHTTTVTCLAWSPDAKVLASGDGALRAAEGTFYLGGGERPTVRLWDAATAECQVLLKGHPDLVLALAWSEDGRALACGTGTGLLRGSTDWDRPVESVPTAFLLDVPRSSYRPLERHTDRVEALAWSPDGALLASGSDDNTVRLWDPRSGECRVVAHCLSPVRAVQFSADGRILRAADDGAATGNRPIPYLFELCNIDTSPPVAPLAPAPSERAAKPAAGTAKRAARPKKPAAKRPARKTAAAPEPAPRPPRKEESMAAAPSMAELLESSGLKYVDLGGGALAVPFKAERADQLVIQVRKLGDDVAFFVVSLPKPGWLSQEGALRNLLQVSFRANYVKALAFDAGELGLAVELPQAVLTPGLVEGVVRGLSHLGDVKGGDLGKWDGWERRLMQCTLAQARRFKAEVEEAGEGIRGLAERAGLRWREVEKDTLVVECEVVGTDLELVIHPREAVISCIVYLGGVKPKGDKKKYMRSLLELNRKVNVAKVGLDSDGDVALLYEVPQVLPDLLDKMRAQVERLFLGVVALEAGRSP